MKINEKACGMPLSVLYGIPVRTCHRLRHPSDLEITVNPSLDTFDVIRNMPAVVFVKRITFNWSPSFMQEHFCTWSNKSELYLFVFFARRQPIIICRKHGQSPLRTSNSSKLLQHPLPFLLSRIVVSVPLL